MMLVEATQLIDDDDNDDDDNDNDNEALVRSAAHSKYKWHCVLHQLDNATRRSLVVPDDGRALTLGRELFGVRSVSRTHAAVQRAAHADSPFLLLRDLGSANGTFVLADASAVRDIGADRSQQDRVALDAARRQLRHRLDARVDVLLRNCDLFRLGPDVTFQVSIERVAVLSAPLVNDVSAIMHSPASTSPPPDSPSSARRSRPLVSNDNTLATQRRPLHSFGTARSQDEPQSDSLLPPPPPADRLAPLPNLNDTQSEALASLPRTLPTQTQLSANKPHSDVALGPPSDMLPPQARPPVIVLSDVQTQPVIVLSDTTQPQQPRAIVGATQAATQAATLMVEDDDSERTEPAEPADMVDSARTVPLSSATQPPAMLKRGSGTLDAANAMELLVAADVAPTETVLSDDETVGTLTDDDDNDDGADGAWVETKRASAHSTPQPPQQPSQIEAAKPNPRRSTSVREKHRTPLDETAIDESEQSDAPQHSRQAQAVPSESSEDSPVLQLKLPEVAPPPPDDDEAAVDADAPTLPIVLPPVEVPQTVGRTGRQRRRPVRFVQSLDADEPTATAEDAALQSAEPTAVATSLSKRKSSSIVQSSPPADVPNPPKRGRRAAAAAAVAVAVESAAVDEAVVVVEEPIAKRGRRASNGAVAPPAELERKTSDGTSSSRRSTRQTRLAVSSEVEVAVPARESMSASASSTLVFLMTACDQPGAAVVQALSDTLPLRFTDDPTDGVTHVVTEQGLSRRTEKILCAFAVGQVRAVVSPTYLTACKRARQLLPESSFAVVDKQTERRLGPLHEALERAARMRDIGAHVLDDIHFWLTPHAMALAPIAPRVIACGRGQFHEGMPNRRTRGLLEVVIAAPDDLAATWEAQANAGFGVYLWQFVADTILAQRVDWNLHFVGGEKPAMQ